MGIAFQNHNEYVLNYNWTKKAFDKSKTLMDFLENYLGYKQGGYGTDDSDQLIITDLTVGEVQALTSVWKINHQLDLNKLGHIFHHHGYKYNCSDSLLWVFDTKNNIQVSINKYGSLALYNERTGDRTVPQESIPFLISVLDILKTQMYDVKEDK